MSIASVLRKKSVRGMVLPISVEQYHKISESGLIGRKTELIEGLIIEKMTKSPLHTYIINLLFNFFADRLPEDYLLRKEDPLTLATSEPEPDLSIVKGSLEDFRTVHPKQAELVIEVAVSSLDLDREKGAIYAAAGIPEYWIVIPEARQVEVYKKPYEGKYKTLNIHEWKQPIETPWGLLDLQEVFD